jgi:hypothetical protein
MVRGAVGAALLASCLQAGAASALSFTFTYTGSGTPISPATVTGIVDGLVDNLNGQTTGLTLTITSSTNTPSGGWNIFNQYSLGSGFNVSGGQIQSVSIEYQNSSFTQSLLLGNAGDISPQLYDSISGKENYDNNSTSANSLVLPR